MATIRDVANKANVCVATVSRMLNKPELVSHDTRKRIRAAMQELNYQPNEMARSLSTKRTHIIGLVVPTLNHHFYSALTSAIEHSCAEHGYKLLVCASNANPDKEHEMISMLRSNKVDGILLCASMADESAYANFDIPMVSVEHIINGIPSVLCDNMRGGALAASALIDSGCRRPTIVTSKVQLENASNFRYTGFMRECARRGVEPNEFILPEDNFFDADYSEVVAAIKASENAIDGIFLTADIHAADFKRFCSRVGLKTPDDYKLIGFDGIELTDYLDISTVAQPALTLGEIAIDTLFKVIDNQIVPEQSFLPVTLISRASTAKA